MSLPFGPDRDKSSGGDSWIPPGQQPVSAWAPDPVEPPVAEPRDRIWVHLVLLLITLATTTLVGGCHYLSFSQGFEAAPPLGAEEGRDYVTGVLSSPSFYLSGLWFSLTVLGILGCHEMGHYVACLRYRVNASRPYFLPAPLPLTGTLGAFIRIRSRIPSKVALFDIGIAGPIAGFVVAVPALFAGLWLSEVVRLPADQSNLVSLGEPLLFRFAAWLVFGTVADGSYSTTVRFTITNTATATGSLGWYMTGVHASQFVILADTCSAKTLAAGAACARTPRRSASRCSASFSRTRTRTTTAGWSPSSTAARCRSSRRRA